MSWDQTKDRDQSATDYGGGLITIFWLRLMRAW